MIATARALFPSLSLHAEAFKHKAPLCSVFVDFLAFLVCSRPEALKEIPATRFVLEVQKSFGAYAPGPKSVADCKCLLAATQMFS